MEKEVSATTGTEHTHPSFQNSPLSSSSIRNSDFTNMKEQFYHTTIANLTLILGHKREAKNQKRGANISSAAAPTFHHLQSIISYKHHNTTIPRSSFTDLHHTFQPTISPSPFKSLKQNKPTERNIDKERKHLSSSTHFCLPNLHQFKTSNPQSQKTEQTKTKEKQKLK
jgi:hypothetical protein